MSLSDDQIRIVKEHIRTEFRSEDNVRLVREIACDEIDKQDLKKVIKDVEKEFSLKMDDIKEDFRKFIVLFTEFKTEISSSMTWQVRFFSVLSIAMALGFVLKGLGVV